MVQRAASASSGRNREHPKGYPRSPGLIAVAKIRPIPEKPAHDTSLDRAASSWC